MKKYLNLRNVAATVALLAVMSVPFTASGQVCQIGSTNYNTVEAAISAVPSGAASATTISMLQDYQVNNGMKINNKKIVFALNGKKLTFLNSTTDNNGRALDLENNSNVSYSGAGEFRVSAVWGVALKGNNSSATVTYVAQTANSMYAVEHQGTGQFVVNGNVDAGSGSGINCHDGGAVTVYGQVYAYSVGVHAQVSANGRSSTIRIYGNVAAVDATNGVGAEANYQAQIFVVGYIWAKNYIRLGSTTYNKTPYPSWTPDGYLDYTDTYSHVLVKPAYAAIGTHNYETVEAAFDAVPAGTATATTVTLLATYSTTTSINIVNKNISFNLNGYTFTVNNSLVFSNGAKFATTGSGAIAIVVSGNNVGIDAHGGSSVRFTGYINAANSWGIEAYDANTVVHIDGNVSNTGPTAAGVYVNTGGRVEINGTLTATKYIQTGGGVINKTGYVLPSDLAGYAKYTDGTSTVYVKGTAPTITGGTPSITVLPGYTDMTTAAFTITGDPAPEVTMASGDSHISWNWATKSINIAPGLTTGSYSAVLRAQNGITPNGTYTFTFIVGAPPICQIGSTNYTALDNAMAAVASGATATIKLLTDIVYSTTLNIGNKKITFDLSGFNLNIYSDNNGININGGSVDFTGTGTFTVVGIEGEMSGGKGIFVQNGGKCHVSNVRANGAANGIGIDVSGSGSSVTVDGDVNAIDYDYDQGNGGFGIRASTGTTVTVNGNVNAAESGVWATGGTVSVKGNITSTVSGRGVYADSGGKVTVDGKITANPYIQTGTVVKSATDFTLPSDKAGYAKYTDGTNTVYVKGAAPTFTGTTASSDFVGYTDYSVSGFTTTGDPSPRITKTSGNALITWNDATQTIDVAAGLAAGSYPVVFTAANGITPNATLNFTLTIKNSLSAIDNVELQNLNIYPNPVKDELRMENGELRIKNVEILDLTGKIILNSQLSTLNSINVAHLASGIYFVKIQTDKGIVTRKFIKE